MSLRAGATTQLHLGNLSHSATVWNHSLSYLQTYFDNDKGISDDKRGNSNISNSEMKLVRHVIAVLHYITTGQLQLQ